MVVFAGQGDGRRSMGLLWRAGGRGRGVGLDAIVDAAVELADAQGVGAISVQAVGERLGWSASVVREQVGGASELVDLAYDGVLGELPTDYASQDGWRAELTCWAEDLWAFQLRHPWVLEVSQARPVLGPGEYRALETVARILHGTGVPAGVLRRAVGVLFQFVRGMAQAVAESRRAATATGVSDEQWWPTRSALLAEFAPDFAERFPMLTLLERERGPQPEEQDAASYLEQEAAETFAVGLTLLLDGIEAAIPGQAGATR
ncbi:AcrR family transcriptional regulator [Kitasatospora sp. MAA4]|uniref:TetR/AcrR family transcriptional regulator n=1 Tax=Kitasatospora sp. MAA4 TaxID=3035093 RepID=UPI0024758B44|nr:TetR/AcrR family transcriptional regulator C-terminal domain-containing protein [Kitasatospora sp. MAA4]MDH6131988.1 AcrR family transcriptional regulator [Kitasatospora sp. MAA4]